MTEAPIVFVHGLLGFDRLPLGVGEYFRGIPEALRRLGYVVPPPPKLNPAGSIASRADDLERHLNTHPDLVGKRFHLIAHSMGGLDARYLISTRGNAIADRVISLTTVATPHHGSPIADLVKAGHEPLARALTNIGVDILGVADLTAAACREFNYRHPNSGGIRYSAIAGRFTPPSFLGAPLGILAPFHKHIFDLEGDNDGLVSIRSATPAGWTSLGVWQANHFRIINWGTNLVPTPAELADRSIVEGYVRVVAEVTRVND
jgi:triacylglycerol lipase